MLALEENVSKFSKLALRKSANLFCCCCRGVSGFGGGFGDGGGIGIELDGVGDSLVDREFLLQLTADSKDGVRSTDGGREGDLVGVELDGGGCDGGAILVVIVSFEGLLVDIVWDVGIGSGVEDGTGNM